MNPYTNAHVTAELAGQHRAELLRRAATARVVRRADAVREATPQRRLPLPRLRRRAMAPLVVAAT
jgi:hypothetical protein